jgi:hypothetical protein
MPVEFYAHRTISLFRVVDIVWNGRLVDARCSASSSSNWTTLCIGMLKRMSVCREILLSPYGSEGGVPVRAQGLHVQKKRVDLKAMSWLPSQGVYQTSTFFLIQTESINSK